jgi:hypothetical protein
MEYPAYRTARPGTFIHLFDRDRLTITVSMNFYKVLRKIANHVTAWDPVGQRELLSVRIRLKNGTCDMKDMRFWRCRRNSIMNVFHR